MHLRRRSGWLSSFLRGRSGAGGCRRWERALYLSASGDLPESAARSLEHHLARCAVCRDGLAQVRRLREACLAAGEAATPERSEPGLWPVVRAAIEGEAVTGPGREAERARPESRGIPPDLRADWAPAASRRPLRAVSLSALAAAALVWLALGTGLVDRTPGSRASLEARWAAEWNDFVSGAPSGRVTNDPFSPIPNPEVIDF